MNEAYVHLLIHILTEQILTSTSKFTPSTFTISSKRNIENWRKIRPPFVKLDPDYLTLSALGLTF